MIETLFLSTLLVFVGDKPADAAGGLRFLRLVDLAGQVRALEGDGERAGSAVVFLSPDCAASRACLPELKRLAAEAGKARIDFYGVITGARLPRARAVEFARPLEGTVPVLFDPTGEVAECLAPEATPEAFVLDSGFRLVYRGRIDDSQVDADAPRREPVRRDLLLAIQALAKGETISPSRTKAIGAPFAQPDAESWKSPTYARHVAPLLHANCAECHRPGQVAPFSLLTYEDAAKRASFLAELTGARLMPPWRAETGFGHFSDERRLTDRQIAILANWAAAGAPRGEEAETPPPPEFPDGWRLGTPDVVVTAPVPFEVPADGPDIFQHFVIPVEIPEGKTLVGFEFRPGNPSVVHHAVIFLDSSGRARQKDAETPEPGYRTSGSVEGGVTAMVGVWTPGNTPRKYPKGIGVRVPKKVDLVLQLHLHPSGKVETDQSSIGLYFAEGAVENVKNQGMFLMGNLLVNIPPQAKRHPVAASITLPVDLTLLSVFPHLHLIGKEMKVTATLPSGEVRPLIWIKDWNFYWQDSYRYHEPVTLPKGTTVRLEAYYDNSSDNPFNPSNPPKRVLFGNASTDEMCFAFFQTVEERGAMMRLAPALFQSFLAEWRKADLDEEAREKIITEAGNLFGKRAGQMLRQFLVTSAVAPEKSGD